MVQEGTSNDEWQMFNCREAQRRECNRNHWANWHSSVQEATPDDDSFENNPFIYWDPTPEPYDVPKPSQTLATINNSSPY